MMDWFWWFFLFFVFGGGGLIADFFTGTGNVFTRIADGRRKATKLKIENKALKKVAAQSEVDRIAAASWGPGTITRLPADTPNAKLLALLYQVQLADEAYPQLDLRLRSRIDLALTESEEQPRPITFKKEK